jgi:3-hydroxymyristoyl/3-hydroxydecanoyl-(acyl carrier protein) dehydratase
MEAGTEAVAEYEIDPGAWFFDADRGDSLPLAILLEAALQPCGWLAAYMGSALNSEEDLVFRNLGGSACQHRCVTRQRDVLTTHVRATKITSAAGMILQSYEFALRSGDLLVYDGTADFGFFPPRAMAEQVGIRDAMVYRMSEGECSRAQSPAIPDREPFPDSRWRMIDQVDEMLSRGGPHGLGLIRGSKAVDASDWFFAAHFMNDPVWPGSLGLESLLQLLKVMALYKWGPQVCRAFESPVVGQTHRWTYRGQIVPTDHRVTVQGEIKACDDRLRRLVADGHLEVDGKIIYQMHDFAISVRDG